MVWIFVWLDTQERIHKMVMQYCSLGRGKQFRFSPVSRLQGYSLDIVTSLYRANAVYLLCVK